MGEEEKKPEEKKVEETKPEEVKKPEEEKKESKEEEKTEKPKEEKKTEESKKPDPPPHEEIVLGVYMHCEGCARKVRRSLKGFEGVEDVQTDIKTHKVVVKGKQADPWKVLERVQKKSHRNVDLLSPKVKPPTGDSKKAEEKKENVKPEQKKEEPKVITILLKVQMHCERCVKEIQKRIMRMKGVQSVDPDLKNSQVTVKGVFDPQNLIQYVYKKTGKYAVIVNQEPQKKEEKVEKKTEAGGGKEDKGEGDKKGEEAKPEAVTVEEEVPKLIELKKNELYYYPQMYPSRYFVDDSYTPLIFSDENHPLLFSDEHHPQIFRDENHPLIFSDEYHPQSFSHGNNSLIFSDGNHAQIFSDKNHPQIFSDENPNACSIM